MQYAKQNTVCPKCAYIRHTTVPVVTSTNKSIGNSVPFSYQIVVSSIAPILSYGATGLPSGLTIDTTTGILSGTVTGLTLGTTVSINISATNVKGTGYGTMTLQVKTVVMTVTPALSGITSTDPIFLVEISVDGSPYAPASLGSSYGVFSQLKLRTTLQPSYTNGTMALLALWTLSGALPLLFGSKFNMSGDAATTGTSAFVYFPPTIRTASTLSAAGTNGTDPTTVTGPYSHSLDVTGLDLNASTGVVHQYGNAGSINNGVMESILNF